MAIVYFEQEVKSNLKDKRRLSTYLQSMIRTHLSDVKKININYIFCSDEYLLGINKQFLQHDTLTDIITFDLSENDNIMDAEIYVSVERVSENAKKFGVTYVHELHRVIFHGALHLCGFKDKKAEEVKAMRAAEEDCLNCYLHG